MSDEKMYKAQEAAKLEKSSWPAFLLIGFGAMLLLARLLDVDLIDYLWPGFIITPGLLLMYPAWNSTEDAQSRLSFLAVPGAILTTVGTLLFTMNMTDHFEAWAYSWTLLIVAAIAGVMLIKRFDPDHAVHTRGHRQIRFLVLLFIGFAAFFEVIIFENFNPLLPVALIGYGVYLLKRENQTEKFA